MLLKTVSIGLLAAAATQAFLLPLEVIEPDAIHVVIQGDLPKTQVVKLACPGCPILVKGRHGNEGKVLTDKPNHLELAFTFADDVVLVNGYELYPHDKPSLNSLWAPQVADTKPHKETYPMPHHGDHGHNDDDNDEHPHHRRPRPQSLNHRILAQKLGFGSQIKTHLPDDDHRTLIEIDFQVFEVGTTFVDGIPAVHLKLVKDPAGKLVLANIETGTSQTLQKTPMDKQEECATLLCKWKALIQDKINRIKAAKGCHGKAGAKAAEKPSQEISLDEWEPHNRPHHGHGHGHGHDAAFRERHHSMGMLFRSIASHILLPILIGIIAGVSVSLVGMIVGTFIVSVWRTFIRKPSHPHAGHSHHHAATKEAAVIEEKAGLMEHQDPPPSYEAEAEAEVGEVDVKKADV
ncbi:hypothetical protein B0T22DRAFT_370905 [Podospora appendiculata]|uniref:DUF7728 domain-containing protein n=1 Tax=Podospora appendiculata TaxID=314037 RepID=A0AAE1CGZ0_9PEZI|nr:hypothetical protein B0T22DRAFT_370905 [Podospora appendiculata]